MRPIETFYMTAVAAFALAGCGSAERADAGADFPRAGAPAHETTVAAAEPAAPAPTAEPAAPSGAGPSDPARAETPAAAPAGAAAAGGSGAAAPADAATAPDAAAILARVEKAYAGVRSMRADFVQRVTVPLLGTDQTSRGEFYQRKPDRILLKFSDPAGDVMVGDGRYFWMYYPSTDRTQVIRARMSEAGGQVDLQQEFLSNPTARYVATLVGKEPVDGRSAQVLTLVPKGRSPYRLVKVWVDEQDALVRRFEILEENESVRRLEFRNLRLNVELPDSLFTFTPPPGSQIFDQ